MCVKVDDQCSNWDKKSGECYECKPGYAISQKNCIVANSFQTKNNTTIKNID